MTQPSILMAPMYSFEFNSGCLTFLVLEGEQRRYDSRSGETRPQPDSPLTYSLETGLVRRFDPTTGDPTASLALRTDPGLMAWEPMTPEKFWLMASELGVVGSSGLGIDRTPGRIQDCELLAVVVNPEGFVGRWGGDPADQALGSDVLRLAESADRPLALHNDWSDYSQPKWDERRNADTLVAGPDAARVGNGAEPLLSFGNDEPILRLTDFSRTMDLALTDSGNGTYHDGYTAEAAEFVRNQFGVDVSRIDWDAANKARAMNASVASTASFDPVAACAALRKAAAPAPTTGLTAGLRRTAAGAFGRSGTGTQPAPRQRPR